MALDPVQLTDGLRKIPESLRITNLTIGDSREKQGLQVGFIAFDYSHPRSIRYRYRLDGYDTDWREVDASDRTVSGGNFRQWFLLERSHYRTCQDLSSLVADVVVYFAGIRGCMRTVVYRL